MKTRYKIEIIFLLIVSMTLSSCKGFLDEIPEDFRTTANSYKDEKSLKAGLIGAYAILKGTYRSNTFFFGILGTDEAMGQVGTIYNDLARYKVPANDSQYIPVWYKSHYQLIAQCNTLISCAEALAPTEGIKYVINEAKMLRAFAYMRLVQIFGPVPLISEPLEGSVDYGKGRDALKDIYSLIISDLVSASAEGALPEKPSTSEPQRATRYVAMALLGRAYVTLASTKDAGVIDRVLTKIGKGHLGYANYPESSVDLYKKAEKVLGDIIGSNMITLNQNYGDLFTIENNNKIGENMWQMQFSTQLNYGQYFMMVMGMWTDNGDLNTRCNTNGMGLCQVTYPKSMWYSYSADDVRRDWNHACRIYFWERKLYQEGDPTTGDTDGQIVTLYNSITKFRHNSRDEMHISTGYTDIWNKPTNQTVVRYADVLLLYAEANLKANGGTATQAGVDAINQIRQRARGFKKDGTPITVSEKPTIPDYAPGNLDMDRILEERKIELCYEGYRWFDLVRTGRLIEKYNEPVYPPNVPLMQQIKLTENHYLYQIPQTEIDGSTNSDGFFQNPLY